MKLFGTDGIRGEAGSFLTANIAMKIGMAAGIYFKENSIFKSNKILIGKDTRRSGYMIENAIVAGLTSVGYDIIQVGPMPTPSIAFITENMRCDAGIVISASHNSFEDNGIKFFDGHGMKLSDEVEKKIENIFFSETLYDSQVKSKFIGKAKRIDDVIGRYIVKLKSSFSTDLTLNGMRIVIDTANGAAYKIAPIIFEELGAEVIVINDKPNGFNINDNCGALYTKDLSQSVIKYRADIGIALDGDADRLVVVDENGFEIDGDHLLGAICVFLKEENKLTTNSMVSTVMSNSGLEDYLNENKIKLFKSKVGDKNVLDIMKKENINFGGEPSGHIVLSDFAKTGDGIVASLQVLSILLLKKDVASKLLRPFNLYPQKLHNIDVSSKIPLDKIDGFNDLIKSIEEKGVSQLIRYSGTEKKLRILLEAKSENILNKELNNIVDFLSNKI